MRLSKNRKGAISILIAASVVMMLGFTALTVDIGVLTYEKSRLQNAADAAALAGAQELPGDTTAAETTARQYITDNDEGGASVSVSFSEEDRKITVTAQQNISYIFARVLGIDDGVVSAQSSAIIAPTGNVVNGLRPFGVVKSVFSLGQQVILKEGTWDSNQGNFAPLAIDGSGASIYRDSIINGSTTGLSVGQYVDTQPGNMVGPSFNAVRQLIESCPHSPPCTATSYHDNCPQIITVPLVDTLMVNGRSEVMVVGFARFFMEDISNRGGHAEITGTFIEEVTVGGVDPNGNDYGLRVVKLVD